MRNVVCVALALTVWVVNVWGGPGVDWGGPYAHGVGGASAPDLRDRNGNAIPYDQYWRVEILKKSDMSFLFAPVSQQNGWDQYQEDGVFLGLVPGAVSDALNGVEIITRIWEFPFGGANTGWYALGGTTTLTWDADKPPPSIVYNFGTWAGGLGTGDGQWRMVPEPSVMGLLGIGIVALAARRRMRKSV
jgi:hypothetical protein